MIVAMLLAKLKSIFLFFINIFRKALCCFRRRRRMSGDVEPLSHIVVNEGNNPNELEQWNDWEFKNRKPASVQEHIEYYRQQQSKLMKQKSQEDEDSQQERQDLFEDMMPKITKQQKVLIGNKEREERTLNLSIHPEAATFVSKELENWDDESGWEKNTLDWDAQELIREKKRQEREKRAWEQQQKRMEKSNRPNVLGAKIAS